MELTHKERVTLQNLDPKCEDCDYYREYNGRLMCHAMAPFYAAKETARRRPRGKTKNCGKEGYYFKPKESNSIKKEKVADLCHEQWSEWMKYLFSKSIPYRPGEVQNYEGALIIPQWAVARWTHQMNTSYIDLTENEKESDRKEADRFLALFASKK